MGFVEAVKTCFRKSTVFRGRAPRPEYWWFTLLSAAVFMPGLWWGHFGRPTADAATGMIFFPLVALYLAIFGLPHLAVSIRRLHDIARPGWVWLVCLLPYVGGVILLVLFCLPGTKGENDFGPDPFEHNAFAAFV
jgi:uncharacterized membrane protein YhaH (DUF805 family)